MSDVICRKISELRVLIRDWYSETLSSSIKLLQVASEIHILFIIREARLEGEHIILGEIAGVGGYLLAQLGKLLGLLADADRDLPYQGTAIAIRIGTFMEEKMDSLEVNQSNR